MTSRRARWRGYFGRHVPGHPNVIVQNKPGASSIVATNYVYESSPRDGTVLAAVQRPIPFQPLLGDSGGGLRYDVRKIQWLGSTTNELGVVVAWHAAPQKTIADVFKSEMVIGGNGPATDTELFPRALNKVLGTKFRIVSGYPGQAQITLAMERGEVQGTGNWSFSDIEKGHADWIRDAEAQLPAAARPHQGNASPALRDVPLILDIARNDDERHVFEILMGMKALGRPYFVAPAVPADRSEALRTAFMQTMSRPRISGGGDQDLGRDRSDLRPRDAEDGVGRLRHAASDPRQDPRGGEAAVSELEIKGRISLVRMDGVTPCKKRLGLILV